MIVVVDYGMGNLGSVRNMLRRIGADAIVSGAVSEIENAEKLILPGVGAFDAAMSAIRSRGLYESLDAKARQDAIPVLGICLGMQLLTEGSDEGVLPGFGWIQGRTRAFPRSDTLKIPHMGWNVARVTQASAFTRDLGDEPRFYFVHSYYVSCDRPGDVALSTHYGVDFASGVQHANIYGAQFHPEKSHRFGMKLLENFASL